MKRVAFAVILGLNIAAVPAWAIDYCDTEVRTVSPGYVSPTGMTPPSDSIVLFDGTDLSQWKGVTGPAAWEVRDGVLTVKKGTGDIQTTRSFQDIQLHLEWRIPKNVTGEGQHRGNSGVFLLDRYEIQILDSYHSRTYANGQAGAVYGQVAPLVNAMRPPGEWNTYDVVFTAPRFNDDGTVFSPAKVTVLQNGVLIQNNAEIQGATGAWGTPGYYEVHASGPIRLQDHPGKGEPVSYRNIWVRELHARAPQGSASETLRFVSTKTIRELLADPAAREVLTRCVPELVPDPSDLEWFGTHTLTQLKGEADITLTDARLKLIDAELVRALSSGSTATKQH
jgi:hypothetical protein